MSKKIIFQLSNSSPKYKSTLSPSNELCPYQLHCACASDIGINSFFYLTLRTLSPKHSCVALTIISSLYYSQ